MQFKLFALVLSATSVIASQNLQPRQDVGDAVGSLLKGKATSILGDITSGAGSIAAQITSGADSIADNITSGAGNLGDKIKSKADAIASGDLGDKIKSKADSITSAIDAHWSSATADIASIGDKIESKYDSISGFQSIHDGIQSAIAGGTAAVADFFSTQTAIAASAAKSIESDAAAGIIGAIKTGTADAASPTQSDNAGTRFTAGAAMGIFGILAGILAL